MGGVSVGRRLASVQSYPKPQNPSGFAKQSWTLYRVLRKVLTLKVQEDIALHDLKCMLQCFRIFFFEDLMA